MRAYVCEDHFNDKDFTSSLKKRLQKYALPTIENCYLHTDISLPSTSFSVCSDLYTTPELYKEPTEITKQCTLNPTQQETKPLK